MTSSGFEIVVADTKGIDEGQLLEVSVDLTTAMTAKNPKGRSRGARAVG